MMHPDENLTHIVVRCVVAATMALSLVRPGVAQQPTAKDQQTGDQPIIVIPPAVTGLSAGSEELQRAVDESILPRSVPELLEELTKRANSVQQLIASGSLGEIWVPAMGTKTVALVLESQTTALPEPRRAAATTAIKRIVTAAWQLDASGEIGNRQRVDEAFARLASAVSDLKGAYAQR